MKYLYFTILGLFAGSAMTLWFSRSAEGPEQADLSHEWMPEVVPFGEWAGGLVFSDRVEVAVSRRNPEEDRFSITYRLDGQTLFSHYVDGIEPAEERIVFSLPAGTGYELPSELQEMDRIEIRRLDPWE